MSDGSDIPAPLGRDSHGERIMPSRHGVPVQYGMRDAPCDLCGKPWFSGGCVNTSGHHVALDKIVPTADANGVKFCGPVG